MERRGRCAGRQHCPRFMFHSIYTKKYCFFISKRFIIIYTENAGRGILRVSPRFREQPEGGQHFMEKQKILVVDDEIRMRKLVKDYLVRKGFEVLEAGDGDTALDIFYEERDIALIILDVMMPGRNGWEVLSEVRESSKVPVVMLTAKSEESDELHGFDKGADDYVTKPFSPKVLTARVEALLRRNTKEEGSGKLEEGGIVIDRTAHQVTIDGELTELSFKEFELLTYFLENKGIALSREKILNNVWNYDYFGDARTIDTHVKKLRSKMGEKGAYIKTIWGMGYKFEVG